MVRPRKPVPRGVVALWAVALLAAVVAVVWLAESLRHPHPVEGVDLGVMEEDAGDPRLPVECPEPPAREDQPDEGEARPPRDTDPVEVTSNDLYDCPPFYDGRVVRFRGEAVGALMQRRVGVWTQLNDDVYAHAGALPAHRVFRGANAGVGVLLPAAAADEIGVVGGPRTHGDIVEVVGVFHRVDDATREVAVIHAREMRVVTAGFSTDSPVLPDRLVAALVLVPLAGAALGLQVWSRRRTWPRRPT